MPQNLDEIAAASAEHVEVPRVGVAAKTFLNLKRQRVHASAHVRHPGRQPYPHAGRNRDHRRSTTASTRASAGASTVPSTVTRTPPASAISIRPTDGAASNWPSAGGASAAGATITGTNPPLPASPSSSRKRRRHSNTRLAEHRCASPPPSPWRRVRSSPQQSAACRHRSTCEPDGGSRPRPQRPNSPAVHPTSAITSVRSAVGSSVPTPDRKHSPIFRSPHRRSPPDAYLVPASVRVWLATGVTDMRRGMNTLTLQVQEGLGRDPHAGALYVFRGRRA